MDQKDLQILRLLLDDGRESYEKISRKVDLNPNTVKIRINKLVEMGVIKRFATQLNISLFNISVCYSLFHTTEDNVKTELIERIGQMPEVVGGVAAIDNKISIVHLFRSDAELHENLEKFKQFKEVKSMENYILLIPRIGASQKFKVTKNDWRIINALKDDCRKTEIEVADEIGLSVKTVKRRISHLRNKGIIRFMIDLDTASGNLLTYNPIIKFKKINSEDLIQINKMFNNPFYIWRIANEETMIYTVFIEHLREIDEQIAKIRQIDNVIDVIKIIPTRMYYFKSWIDDFIQEKAEE
nr:winged helix-turn-helix transcriptional regulator [Candidatus Freyarchaeota archaeon]